jgi:hypothetical protein
MRERQHRSNAAADGLAITDSQQHPAAAAVTLAAHFFLFKKPGERARGRREREREKTFQSERKGVAAGVCALVCCAVTAS